MVVCATLNMEQRNQRQELSNELRKKIIDVSMLNRQATRRISMQLRVPWNTADKIIKKYKVHGTTIKFLGSGHKKKCNPRLIRQIVQTLEKEPRKPFKAIQAKLQGQGT